MQRVVVESPYAGDIAFNTAYARACLRDCIDRGEAPIASHLLYPQVLDEHDPLGRELGISLGYQWIRVADKVVFYTDFGMSKGMKVASHYAAEHKIQKHFRQLSSEELLKLKAAANASDAAKETTHGDDSSSD